MSDREMYASTIFRLVDYFGGYERVALILKVNVDDLERWAEGRARPPTHVFLRLVDMKDSPPAAQAAARGEPGKAAAGG